MAEKTNVKQGKVQRLVGCMGGCEEHGDEIKLYNVKASDGHDWGDYWYCDEAVRIDTDSGFTVKEVTPND